MTESTRNEVYHAIDGERDYQDACLGNATRDHIDDNRELGSLILLTEEYLLKVRQAFSGPHPEGRHIALNHMRKVAALAVLTMEKHGVVYRT